MLSAQPRLMLVCAVLWTLSTLPADSRAAAPYDLVERFSDCAEGSSGEPRWDAQHMGFSVRGGALQVDIAHDRGVAILKAAPFGRQVTIEANLTLREARGKQWKTAGLGLSLDEHNFWHLALVEAPDGRHAIELAEMLDGQWLAHSAAKTRVKTIEERGPATAWLFNHPYRLRLVLGRDGGPQRITGEVFDGARLCYRCVRELTARAVDYGRPMLTVAAFTGSFDTIHAHVDEIVPAPVAAKQALPPFAWTPLGSEKPGRATGFFRVEADGATWWLVDPQGQRTLSIGTDHVRYEGHWCEALGYSPYGRLTAKRYADANAWAAEATQRLRQWNFNVLGAGQSRQARYRGLAHTEFMAFGSDFSSVAALVEKTTWTGWPDVFDPRFERFCELRARQRCEPHRDDPWLLGYFLDNELEWWGKRHQPWGLATEACKLPATAAGKKALVQVLERDFRGDVAAFNAAFDAKLQRIDELLTLAELPPPKTERAKQALAAFVAAAAERYFQITTAAVRRHDPQHLVIGCRFAHDAPESAWRAAGATCDVVTVNVYPRIDLWRQRAVKLQDHLRERFGWCGKPMILTEWSFPALDAKDSTGQPLPSQHGAGMRVDTQEQKAACYAIFQRELFALPFMIGSHYFMWSDEPALGISSTFPEDSNYGLVSEANEPYPALTATATRVNAQMMALHAGRIPPAAVAAGRAPVHAAIERPAHGSVQFRKTAQGYTLETDCLRLAKTASGGALFDTVACRFDTPGDWIELGSYQAVMCTGDDGAKSWTHADRVTAVRTLQESAERIVLEIECAHQAAPAWKAAYQVEVQPGRPWFRARAMWVANAGTSDLRLADYFHYLPSRIGGDARDDEPGKTPTNYWLKVASWRDPKLRVHYGVVPPQSDERMHAIFWKDSGQHPDCMRKIDCDLKPAQRWNAAPDEPWVTIFGLRATDANPRPWAELTSP